MKFTITDTRDYPWAQNDAPFFRSVETAVLMMTAPDDKTSNAHMGKVLAQTMADKQDLLREAALTSFCRHYVRFVDGASEWKEKLAPVFHKAAALNNLPQHEIDRIDNNIAAAIAAIEENEKKFASRRKDWKF